MAPYPHLAPVLLLTRTPLLVAVVEFCGRAKSVENLLFACFEQVWCPWCAFLLFSRVLFSIRFLSGRINRMVRFIYGYSFFSTFK